MKDMINAGKKVISNKNIIWREVDKEAVILNVESNNYYTLNEIGTKIWKNFSKKNTLQDIIRELQTEYDISEEHLMKDIKDLIIKLKKEGLVEVI